MVYVLLHKDNPVAIFSFETEVVEALFRRNGEEHLPLPLKRIIHFKDEFVAEENPDYVLNEEGCTLFDYWLNDRTIPLDREHAKERYTRGKSSMAWMLANHSLSLDDCYWTKEIDDPSRWEDVKLFGSSKIDVLQLEKLSDKERKYSGINSTLGGSLEKYWFNEENESGTELRLCKRVELQNDILCVREILANIVCEHMGYTNYVRYNYVINREGDIVGCHCKAFTNEGSELVTAYDLLEEYNYTQRNDVYEKVIELAAGYGLEEERTRKHLEFQILMDYLITNRDRHQGNIGFLRDPDSLKIIDVAPIYDSGSSASMEYENPLGVEVTKVNGLYSTVTECLNCIRNISLFDMDRIPKADVIAGEIDKCKGLSEYRRNFLKELYTQKVEWLKSRTK